MTDEALLKDVAEAIWYAQHASPGTFERAWADDATHKHWSNCAEAVIPLVKRAIAEAQLAERNMWNEQRAWLRQWWRDNEVELK